MNRVMKRVRTSAEGFWRGGYNGNKAGLKKKKKMSAILSLVHQCFKWLSRSLGTQGAGRAVGWVRCRVPVMVWVSSRQRH